MYSRTTRLILAAGLCAGSALAQQPGARPMEAGRIPPRESTVKAARQRGASITMSALPGAQASTLSAVCAPGRPALTLHVRITNTGQTALPALPLPKAIIAVDQNKPAWTGGAPLPPLAPGASAAVSIPLIAPLTVNTISGTHRFTFHAFGQNGTDSVLVNIPSSFCATALNRRPRQMVILSSAQAATLRSRFKIPNSSVMEAQNDPRMQSLHPKFGSINTSVGSAKNQPVMGARYTLPIPLALHSTTQEQECTNHAGLGGGLACKALLSQGKLALVWNYAGPDVDGFQVYWQYRQGGIPMRLVGNQKNGKNVTLYIVDAPPPDNHGSFQGVCYFVASFKATQQSQVSDPYCVGAHDVVQTALFPAAQSRNTGHHNFIPTGAIGTIGETNNYSSGPLEVGFSYATDKSWTGDDMMHDVFRSGLWFDVSPLAGKKIRSARLLLSVNRTELAGDHHVDHSTSCTTRIGRGIDRWWNNTDWIDSGGEINFGQTYGPDVAYDVTPIVQEWVTSSKNFGLVLMGAREDMRVFTDDACLTDYDPDSAQLTVEFF